MKRGASGRRGVRPGRLLWATLAALALTLVPAHAASARPVPSTSAVTLAAVSPGAGGPAAGARRGAATAGCSRARPVVGAGAPVAATRTDPATHLDLAVPAPSAPSQPRGTAAAPTRTPAAPPASTAVRRPSCRAPPATS